VPLRNYWWSPISEGLFVKTNSLIAGFKTCSQCNSEDQRTHAGSQRKGTLFDFLYIFLVLMIWYFLLFFVHRILLLVICWACFCYSIFLLNFWSLFAYFCFSFCCYFSSFVYHRAALKLLILGTVFFASDVFLVHFLCVMLQGEDIRSLGLSCEGAHVNISVKMKKTSL